MKSKHYPLITFAAASTLVLLPLSLVLMIPSPDSESLDEAMVQADSDFEKASQSVTSGSVFDAEPVTSPERRPATRVAMLPEQTIGQSGSLMTEPLTPTLNDSTRSNAFVTSEAAAELAVQPQVSTSPVASTWVRDTAQNNPTVAEDVPAQQPSPFPTHSEFPAVTSANDLRFSPTIASRITSSPNSEETDSGTEKSTEELNQALEEEMAMAMNVGATGRATDFGSTGHLAMAGADRSITSAARERNQDSQKASQRKLATESNNQDLDANAILAKDNPYSTDLTTPIVEVALQQPSERRVVRKVEDVIATTQEKGWPIALVRSDLPDALWWVQQTIDIRNQAFMSRVNFGNDRSIPGSVYHLVIVFLDGPEEARRFRIAKQFKKLPEGLRRSREFTFVRR